jgi:hypothetical protein
MGGCERGHRFTQGQLPPLRIHDVTTEEAKWGRGGGYTHGATFTHVYSPPQLLA